MSYLVRAFPLIRPVSELEEFVRALGEKRASTATFYASYGITHESVHLQEEGDRKFLIVVTLVEDVQEAGPRYKVAADDFEAWFKGRVLHLTGVDPNVTPLGPPTRTIFSWPA
jgi:hypothetical protein